MRRNAAYGIVPTCAVGAEAQREGVLPTVVAEQYAQLLVEVDGTWASRVQQSPAECGREASGSILRFGQTRLVSRVMSGCHNVWRYDY